MMNEAIIPSQNEWPQIPFALINYYNNFKNMQAAKRAPETKLTKTEAGCGAKAIQAIF